MAESGLHDLKKVIVAANRKNTLEDQKSLKKSNWKYYSMKIVAKYKKSWQSKTVVQAAILKGLKKSVYIQKRELDVIELNQRDVERYVRNAAWTL